MDGRTAWPVRSEDGDIEYISRTATGVWSVPGASADALTQAAGPVELLRFGQVAGTAVELLNKTLAIDLDGDGRADSADIRISDIVNGARPITADTALRLGLFFSMEPRFWLNLQTEYDMRRVLRDSHDQIAPRIRVYQAPADAGQ